MDKLIDECTLILGWCFSTENVEETKNQQRQLARSALAKMEVFCTETEETEGAEDLFGENYELLQPLISAENSGRKMNFSILTLSLCIWIINYAKDLWRLK